MRWLAHVALRLCRIASYWPIRSQRLRWMLQLHEVALDVFTYEHLDQHIARLMPRYVEAFEAVHGGQVDGDSGACFMARHANLGGFLIHAGHEQRGQELLDRATAYFREHSPSDNPVWAGSIFNLGATLLSLERPAEALPWMQQALAMRTRVHGADSFEAAQCHNNLGCCLKDLGRFAEAEAANREALRLHEKHTGANSPQVAAAKNNLAETYLKNGRAADALPWSQEAVALSQPGDTERCTLLATLAQTYEALGRHREARLVGDQAIAAAVQADRCDKAIEYSREQAVRLDKAGHGDDAAAYREVAAKAGRLVYFGNAEGRE